MYTWLESDIERFILMLGILRVGVKRSEHRERWRDHKIYKYIGLEKGICGREGLRYGKKRIWLSPLP